MQRILAVMLCTAVAAPGAELNVRNVILYKHGVGYFERAGDLAAGESARLDFKADEMNDVLKSLTLGVTGGAGVAGLRYDSSVPFEQKIDEIPVRLATKQPISTLLDQLKGARLELKLGAETVAGAIISARVAASGRDQRRARTDHAAAGLGRIADAGSLGGLLDPVSRSQAAVAIEGLSGGGDAGALEREAQRLHRFGGRGAAADRGQLHDPDAGLEIELPADVRRDGRTDAGRLGDRR